MPIYEMNFDDSPNPIKMRDMRLSAKDGDGNIQKQKSMDTKPIGLKAQPLDDIWFERQNVNMAEEIHELSVAGLYTMDKGIKNYFSGIRVQTKDGVKIVNVRVSGGDKAYLMWRQELQKGRVELPIIAIRRDSDDHNAMKFSPAHYHRMGKRFLDTEGSRIELTYRPVPLMINYTLSVWAEHKRDLEQIHYQIRTRFMPVAEYMVEDEHMSGSVLLKCSGMTNSMTDDMAPEERADKRYDYSLTMEGWMPLPTKVVPSILGRVFSFKEDANSRFIVGDTLQTILGQQNLPSAQIRR